MPTLKQVYVNVATVFGIGRSQWAPGTLGTLAAVPLCWATSFLPIGARLIVWILVFWAGIWSAGNTARALKKPDPSDVVIDEVLGFQLLILAVTPSWVTWTMAFFAFRVFDVLKLFPANWVDAWSKKQKNSTFRLGFGIIADDLVAALQALVVLWIFHQFGWVSIA